MSKRAGGTFSMWLVLVAWCGSPWCGSRWCESQAQAQAAPPITCAVFAADGEQVIVGSQLGLEVRSWPQLENSRRIATRLTNVHDLAFSPSGDALAAVGGRPGEVGELEIFAWPSGEALAHRKLGPDLLYAVAWLNDERLVAGGEAGMLLVVKKTGEGLSEAAGHSRGVLDVAVLPGGGGARMIVSASCDFTLRLWSEVEATGMLDGARTLTQHAGAAQSLAVRPRTEDEIAKNAAAVLASAGDDRTVRFWQPAIGRQIRFARLPSPALAIDWEPSGQWLLAACADGKLRVVDYRTVEIAREIPAIEGWAYAIAAHPDGERALVAGEGGQVVSIDYRP
jgi:WD40 repeat protein